MEYPGNLYAVAAPSGAGKSSLVKALLELDSHLTLSISHTTRKPRGQDQHGREYHFVDEKTFRSMIDRGEFVEWAEVHGHLYGTSRAGIEDRITGGNDVLTMRLIPSDRGSAVATSNGVLHLPGFELELQPARRR